MAQAYRKSKIVEFQSFMSSVRDEYVRQLEKIEGKPKHTRIDELAMERKQGWIEGIELMLSQLERQFDLDDKSSE